MKEKSNNRALIRRFLPYYKEFIGVVILDLFCASLTTVCELILPMMVRYITDKAMNDLAALTVKSVLIIGALYLVLRLIDTAANYYMTSIGHIMGTRIETRMRSDLFHHLQKLPFSYYDETKIGTLMSRITSDLFDITEFAHHCPEEFFIASIKIAVSLGILSTINLWLTLIIFAIIPLTLLVCIPFRRRMKEGFRDSRVVVGEINSQVEDSLLGIRVVKSFANESLELEKFEQGNRRFLEIKRKVYHAMAGFTGATRFFDGVMYITVVVAGALFMIGGHIQPADLVAYLLYVSTLLTSVRRIIEFSEQFYRGMTGIERFAEIMDTPVTIADPDGAKELTDVRGDITFQNVTFRYNENGENVLHELSLNVDAGKTIARRAAGKQRCAVSCRAFTTSRTARYSSTTLTCASCRSLRSAAPSAWCSRTCICSRAAFTTTSPMASPVRPARRSRKPRGWQVPRTSSSCFPTGTTPTSANAVSSCRAVRSNASPSPVCS